MEKKLIKKIFFGMTFFWSLKEKKQEKNVDQNFKKKKL
jgi:hypothetical protein